jgi:hypothetical protein
MKNYVVITLLGLFLAFANISFGSSLFSGNIPDCCKKKLECCKEKNDCCHKEKSICCKEQCCKDSKSYQEGQLKEKDCCKDNGTGSDKQDHQKCCKKETHSMKKGKGSCCK